MEANKRPRNKVSWGAVALGSIMLFVGGMMIIQGIGAYKTGAVIPQTMKSGPMTGLHSIITGVLASCGGLGFLGIEAWKRNKRRRS